MLSLDHYLKKATTLLAGKFGAVKTVQEVLKEQGIDISEENIVIKNGVLRCNVSPILKSALFMKKEKILAAINEKIPKNVILKIE